MSRALAFAPSVLFAVLGGCSSTKFAGQVVNCVDQKPVPSATLSYKVNDKPGAPLPPTNAKGKFETELDLLPGTEIVVKAEKNGYEPKEERMTIGKQAPICLTPK
jgi:hypothetical protein